MTMKLAWKINMYSADFKRSTFPIGRMQIGTFVANKTLPVLQGSDWVWGFSVATFKNRQKWALKLLKNCLTEDRWVAIYPPPSLSKSTNYSWALGAQQ